MKKKVAKAAKPIRGVIVVDESLLTPEGEEALKKQERRGYKVHRDNLKAYDYGRLPVFIILAPNASWFAPDMWGLFDKMVKEREKEVTK